MEDEGTKRNNTPVAGTLAGDETEPNDSASALTVQENLAASTAEGGQQQRREDNGAEAEAEEGEDEEADGDDDDDEEDEEEEDGETYKLRFEGEMNPLAFVEDDAFGVQPYQQFERLENEYEALAAKKRKANPNDKNSGLKKEVDGGDQRTKLFQKPHEKWVMLLFSMHIAAMKRQYVY